MAIVIIDRTPYGLYVYCDDHHNPDGYGVGRCDYYAVDERDAHMWYWDHVEEDHDNDREDHDS